MKNTFKILIITIILALSTFSISLAQEQKISISELQSKNLTLNDRMETYIMSLNNISFIPDLYLNQNTNILISKDFPTIFGKATKHTVLYFYKNQPVKIEFELKHQTDKEELLKTLKEKYNNFQYQKNISKQPYNKKENHIWQNENEAISLTYNDIVPQKPLLSITLTKKHVIDDLSYFMQ